MGSATERIAAKRKARLCTALHPDCGNRAPYPYARCFVHTDPRHHVARAYAAITPPFTNDAIEAVLRGDFAPLKVARRI